MRMAFILFDNMTTLDFAGYYEAVTWMGILNAKKKISWDFCSNKQQITDDRGLTVKIDHVLPDLSAYDLIFIPGGLSTRQLRYDDDFMGWLQTAQSVEYK